MRRLRKCNKSWMISIVLITSAFSGWPQSPRQADQPRADASRQHQRVPQSEVPGRRIGLRSLSGTRLFAGPAAMSTKPVPLIVHFHGAPWLIESHISRNLPNAVLITVQLGAGSGAYGRPFQDADLFSRLIEEAAEALTLKNGWASISLTGFSAGYGAIRAILRQENNYRRVSSVLLLDGIHASYLPEGKPATGAGIVNAEDLDAFLRFSRDAAAGRKAFVITHSEIVPGTYASTTECTDHLITSLRIKRKTERRPGPYGMQQLSRAGRGRFVVMGYAGDTPPDHIDHLHAMPAWFRYIGVK